MINKFIGCLLGGAVGDALGAPVEFMKRAEIIRRFGSQGITQYALAYGGLGFITDDTQMTLFTAEGMLNGYLCHSLSGMIDYQKSLSQAYLRWLMTQGEQPVNRIDLDQQPSSWLINQPQLHHRRAPGLTCLSALLAMTDEMKLAHNNSKGCGGVMRVAPIGLFASRQPDVDSFELGIVAAALTHGHPTGSLTAGVFSQLIHSIIEGFNLVDALSMAKNKLITYQNHEETLLAIERAEKLACSNLIPEQAIAQLGEGWVAEEALAISIYCSLIAKSFEEALIIAVNHDGDSDSTGAITGNILGALQGVSVIPSEWLEHLELREVIKKLATDLYDFPNWNTDRLSS
ncbi:ADP-ribosylglycohydrolase family protein [Pseudomonas sp. F1_0610]|uniref:ADP-ribosylglycohydrolase family protein n=1 Tax=Pseudomonas sp. F1_0610 TaxID=3114284 RepID=UPI0039C2A75B